MKNLYSLLLCGLLFLTLILGCANPFRQTNLYKCKSDLVTDPKSAEDYVKIGTHHGNTGERDCALGACAEAIRLDPEYARAYSCRGIYLEDRSAAMADFNRAIQLDPKLPDPYTHRSGVYDERGDIDRALADMNMALKLCETNPECFDSYVAYGFERRARLYVKKQDYERALGDYTEAIRLVPKPTFYSDRAELYEKMGRAELAADDRAKAAELENAKSGESDKQESPSPNESPTGEVISLGLLNEKAASMPLPAYPPIARAARASGTVHVGVWVDETGAVVKASAVSGHPLLHAASVAAARRARFKPLVRKGKATRFSGYLEYKFVPPN